MRPAVRLVLAAVVGFGLSACVEEGAGDDRDGPPGKPLSAAERSACLAKGGSVGRGGLLPDELCFLPEPDAGKSCMQATDCSGLCLADTMTCSPVSPMLGCFQFLDETGRKLDICID